MLLVQVAPLSIDEIQDWTEPVLEASVTVPVFPLAQTVAAPDTVPPIEAELTVMVAGVVVDGVQPGA